MNIKVDYFTEVKEGPNAPDRRLGTIDSGMAK
jgi:hypothetical protein